MTAAEVVQSSVVAEEPGPEELAPVTEDHFIKEKESVQEKLSPFVAGAAAQSPEESPVIIKAPEAVLFGDQVSEDADGVVSQESVVQELSAAAPQEASEVDTVPVEAAFAEASLDEATEEVAPAVAVESDSPDLHYEKDQPQVAVIPLEASEDKTPDKNAEEEAAQEESLFIVPDGNTEVGEMPLHLTPEEEKSLVLVPAEHETEEAGQEEPAVVETPAGLSAPEEPAVIVPVEPTEQESDQEETAPIFFSETKEEETLEEQVTSLVVKENTEVDPPTHKELLPRTLEEEESVALFSIELEGQVEPAAEETAPKESVPENPAVIVLLDNAEEEPELEEQFQEESFPIVSPEAPDEEAPEECTEVEVAGVPAFPEENAQQDLATNEEPLPSTAEEQESVVLIHVEQSQEEPAVEETAPEKPAIDLVEPTSEEPAPEDSILVILLEDGEKDAPEDDTEEEVVQSDPLQEEAALLGDDTTPQNDAGDSDADILATSETETTEKVLEPGKEVAEVHFGTLDPVTAPAPAVTHAEAETIPAPVEGGNGTGMKTHSDGFKAIY